MSASPAVAQTFAHLYVAPSAAAMNDGRTQDKPLNSLDSLPASLANQTGTVEVDLLPGIYNLANPLQIKFPNVKIVITALQEGTVVLNGAGTTSWAIDVHSDNVTISKLNIHSFARDGIRIQQAAYVHIEGNQISDIRSNQWSAGGVHALLNVNHIIINNNRIDHTGMGGILVDSSTEGHVSDIQITGNHVSQTCLIMADCGAIYANGRAPNTTGVQIIGNVITNFGPPGTEANGTFYSNGIYMDDGLSNALVSQNIIRGTGGSGILVHGGSNNQVKNNRICVSGVTLAYQGIPSLGEMNNNIIAGNYFAGARPLLRGKYVGTINLAANTFLPEGAGGNNCGDSK